MLENFLNKVITEDGFLLETSDKKVYTIGKPIKKQPIKPEKPGSIRKIKLY